jgi:hypothetical protein
MINTERAKYYERKAADARAKSEAITDLEARETMLQVAQMWEFLARSANHHHSRPKLSHSSV